MHSYFLVGKIITDIRYAFRKSSSENFEERVGNSCNTDWQVNRTIEILSSIFQLNNIDKTASADSMASVSII